MTTKDSLSLNTVNAFRNASKYRSVVPGCAWVVSVVYVRVLSFHFNEIRFTYFHLPRLNVYGSTLVQLHLGGSFKSSFSPCVLLHPCHLSTFVIYKCTCYFWYTNQIQNAVLFSASRKVSIIKDKVIQKLAKQKFEKNNQCSL